MSGFPRALPFILDREGGYVHHPEDRGGATNMGITQGTYNAWRRDHNLGLRNIRDIHEDEVASIYHERYWVKAACDAWWWPLNLAVFDASVNHGPKTAVKLLQRAAGADDDGIVGPKTVGAVAEMERDELLARLRWERLEHYARIVRSDPSQSAFIVGWVSRVKHLDRELAA